MQATQTGITVPQGVTNAKMKIYTVGGQRSITINQVGDKLEWDGRQDDGSLVKNGVYLMRMEVGGVVTIVPVAVVK